MTSPDPAAALDGRAAELLDRFGSPLYVYDEATLRARCRALRGAVPLPGVAILYAAKANGNPELLKIVRSEGLGLDAVSIGEVEAALRAGFPPSAVSYNGNNVTAEELRAVVAHGVHVGVDSTSQLETVARAAPGIAVALRINADVGDGHHAHVVTSGPEAKFGIAPEDVPEALAVARRLGARVDGLHQHIGSGVLDPRALDRAVDALLDVARGVPDLAFVDFGGGFGVPYRPDDRPLDLAAWGAAVAPRLAAFRRAAGRATEFRFEPGRYVVAECGTLYVTTTSVKRTATRVFAGVDSGFNHLARPMIYDAYHPIRNATRPEAPRAVVTIAGYVCESGDVFARDREIPHPREGDVLAIGVAGAYGWSMASTYNRRPRPAEVLVGLDGRPRLIRRRETLADLDALDV